MLLACSFSPSGFCVFWLLLLSSVSCVVALFSSVVWLVLRLIVLLFSLLCASALLAGCLSCYPVL